MFINRLFIGKTKYYAGKAPDDFTYKPTYAIVWNEGGKHMVFALEFYPFNYFNIYFSVCENKKWHRWWIRREDGVWKVFINNRLHVGNQGEA